ncbi:MAG TPA: SMP-30/gluconolactonase/LRE family protein [Xanthobacteraceae bacterium]|nr:SMP-30/gluconolactonase/LRE family protein [Xanthobacteraceae bacterium]
MADVAVSILSAHACRLGEGSTYDAASDGAWWFDILERRLFRAHIGTGEVESHALPVMGSALCFIDDAHQLIAADDGLYVRELAGGRLTLHTPLEADNAANRSNDGRVHPCGALWIGTMGREAEPGAGAIYHFFEGTLRRLYGGISIPNAICFSPDGATAYFTDTSTAMLCRVAVDPLTGLPLGEPAMLYDHRGGEGGLDGAVVDAQGLIWNARWDGACLDVYTPEGARVRTIALPARRPTCPAFVGRGYDRLLVTSAAHGLDDGAPQGCTFLLDVGARGRPEPRVRMAS